MAFFGGNTINRAPRDRLPALRQARFHSPGCFDALRAPRISRRWIPWTSLIESGSPLGRASSRRAPGKCVEVVADLLDIRAWSSPLWRRLEVEQVDESRLGSLDLR